MFDYEVVVCTYNGERYIVEQLASIVGQTISPRRIIVSDDGSTDNTLKLIADFAATTSVPFYVQQRVAGPKGPAHNFLHVLSLTTATNVFLSDQDDVWVTDKIEYYQRAVSRIGDEYEPLLIFSDAELVDSELRFLSASFLQNERLNPDQQLVFPRLLFQNCIQGATVMVNRSLLKHLRPSQHMLMHDWWLGLLATTFGRLVFLPERLIKYRQHANNVVGSSGYGLKRILVKFMRLPSVAHQNRLVIEQAISFYEIYGEELKKEDKKFLERMLRSRRFVLWQLFLLKCGVARTTITRTISLYFLY
ncbi:glycosyltransferase family 2 protein [Providencia rustigianii]|uniref:glycosyltransferase family 2 protein n=1 Tax=Providencia rustigianii TaxID=158850 RepID=UPI00223EAD13|nr:glycosyltransferase family 2 protein [Providencia rustigianii]